MMNELTNKPDKSLEIHIPKDYLDIIKRTERIVAAFFVVTDILEQGNPLGQKIRTLSIDLLSSLIESASSLTTRVNSLKNYSRDLFETIALLEIGFFSGHISEMNFKIISSEAERLISVSVRLQTQASPSSVKIGDIFSPDTERTDNGTTKLLRGFFDKGHKRYPYKGHKIHKKDIPMSFKNSGDSSKVRLNKGKDSRKSIIVSALGEGKHLNVKDFSVFLVGVGEKTIQRDLANLVRLGVLKREGERRWSRYFIEKHEITDLSERTPGISTE
ncbi:MAG TPA: hypothetical protein VJH94_05255 [Candidatus Paceibacterota bacterium]